MVLVYSSCVGHQWKTILQNLTLHRLWSILCHLNKLWWVWCNITKFCGDKLNDLGENFWWGFNIYGHGGHHDHVTQMLLTKFSPPLKFDWLSGFWENTFEHCGQTYNGTPGAWVFYKHTRWAFSSDKLICALHKSAVNSVMWINTVCLTYLLRLTLQKMFVCHAPTYPPKTGPSQKILLPFWESFFFFFFFLVSNKHFFKIIKSCILITPGKDRLQRLL